MRFSACPPSSQTMQSPGITLQPVSSTPAHPTFGGYRMWDNLANGIGLPILPRSQEAVFPPSCFECSYKHCQDSQLAKYLCLSSLLLLHVYMSVLQRHKTQERKLSLTVVSWSTGEFISLIYSCIFFSATV